MEITGNGCSSGNEKGERKFIERSGMKGITWDHVLKAQVKQTSYIYEERKRGGGAQGVY